MKKLLLIGSTAIAGVLSVALVMQGQAPGGATKGKTAAAPAGPSDAKKFVNQYCVGCHGQAAKAAKMESARHITLDDLDIEECSIDLRSGDRLAAQDWLCTV